MNPDHAVLRAWSAPVSVAHDTPLGALLDLRIDAVDRERGTATLRCSPAASLRNARGEPDGRAIAAMLDYGLGFAAMPTLEPPAAIVTATLRIDHVTTSTDATFVVEGRVDARNATTLVTSSALYDTAGTLLALARGTLRLV